MTCIQVRSQAAAVPSVQASVAVYRCVRLKPSANPTHLNRSKAHPSHSPCKRLCTCCAATPAQLDSAKAQENGVGKAQAGTLSYFSRWCLHAHTPPQVSPHCRYVQRTLTRPQNKVAALDVSRDRRRKPKWMSVLALTERVVARQGHRSTSSITCSM